MMNKRKNSIYCLLWIIIVFLPVAAAYGQATVTVPYLRCENRIDPLGIDTVEPRLSWVVQSSQRGQNQTAYQILVAGDRKNLDRDTGDWWDTGKALSNETSGIVYHGKSLSSHRRCFWKVRVWDKEGVCSAWSEPAMWTIGLLNPSDWQAVWIGWDEAAPRENESVQLPARMVRKEFTIEKKLDRAVAYISGLGWYELYLNGQKAGDHVLAPGQTDYDKLVFYETYDITDQLREGRNAVGIWLGNGRYYGPRINLPIGYKYYGYPKVILHLRLEYEDGSTEYVVSDEQWKITSEGPIVSNNEYDGEEYDARQEMPGWCETGFDDSNWKPVQKVEAPKGKLVCQYIEPIRVTETIQPKAMTNPQPGMYIYDMGQNFVGWCRLRVKGPRGTEIRLRHAEVLNDQGALYLDNLRSCKVTDSYILKGEGTEFYEPRFSYHGFRYVEMTGYPGAPDLSVLEGKVIHDDLRKAGDFSCSNPLLNQIYKNIVWGTRGNYHSIPTDCPQRDERQGWLGDRAAESRGEAYFYDVANFYSKWLTDIQLAQSEKGEIPDVAPPFWNICSNNMTWPSVYTIIPDWHYVFYADRRVLERHYPNMKKWMAFMSGFLENGIMPQDQYGDWCVPPESPELIHSQDPRRVTCKAILGTTYYYKNLLLLAHFAGILEKPQEAREYADQAEKVKQAFHAKFFNPGSFDYDNGTQTASILALAFAMVPQEYEQQVFEALVNKILIGTQGHVGTGLIGGQWLMRVLSDHGRADVAYTLATQKDYPSWGYMIENQATTIWELWNGNTADPAMNSHNHLMLVGDLTIWFYEYLAGIRPDPSDIGFRRILIKPHMVGDLTYVRATFQSIRGEIRSAWEKVGNTISLEIVIPANATATVYVPAAKAEDVREDDKPIPQNEGIQFIRMENGAAVFNVESGQYHFTAPR